MLSLSSLIEFLLDLMRNPTTQNDYARDPQGTLAARGLSSVTPQDVHDVQPLLADQPGVSASVGGAHAAPAPLAHHSYGHSYGHPYAGGHGSYAVHYGSHDPATAIQHVTNAYEVDHSTVVRNVTQEYKQYATYKSYVTDNSVHADHGGSVVQDSFNQDNDGVDLKGATVDDSVLAGHDANGSGNHVDPTTTQGSNDDDHSTGVIDSHDDTSSENDTNVGDDHGTHHEQDSHDDNDLHHSYAADAPDAPAADDGGDALAAHH